MVKQPMAKTAEMRKLSRHAVQPDHVLKWELKHTTKWGRANQSEGFGSDKLHKMSHPGC